jgi:hypothetical protein
MIFHLPGVNPNYWSAYTLQLKTHVWWTGTSWRKIHLQVWRWQLLSYSSLHSWCIFIYHWHFQTYWSLDTCYLVTLSIFGTQPYSVFWWMLWSTEVIGYGRRWLIKVTIWKHCTVLVITDNKECEISISVLSSFPSPCVNSSCSTSKYYKYVWSQYQMISCTARTIMPESLTTDRLCHLSHYFIRMSWNSGQYTKNCAAAYKQVTHKSKRHHQKTLSAFHCAMSTAYAFNGLGICQGLSKIKRFWS